MNHEQTAPMETTAITAVRYRIEVSGAVQGVGFRPFIYRLAREAGLSGWVKNSAQGLQLEVEGERNAAEGFLQLLRTAPPPNAIVRKIAVSALPPVGGMDFAILPSDTAGHPTPSVLQDLAMCGDCLEEIRDPANRRYRYPFTNCTQCGPRFSIVERLPYDRDNTTMRRFTLCADCRAEYENPDDRRFHAQPNACPACGPRLELWDAGGSVLAHDDTALVAAADRLRAGGILAVKGIGGFHLMADARNEATVRLLRDRKHRAEKPFAVMFPSLASITGECVVSDLEETILLSPSAPIVLLRKQSKCESSLSEQIAPGGNPYLGAFLPYSPLHRLLLDDLGFPVVATSANLAEEVLCIDNQEARARLGGIVDAFLVHDRPIARPLDDSVVQVVLAKPRVLRRARGYAPLPVGAGADSGILALGGHLKNTIAVSTANGAVLSQHLGDLDNKNSRDAFHRAIPDFIQIMACPPARVACDLHPDYTSTLTADTLGIPVLRVQHHEAHVLSCMAENRLTPPCLGVAWDGTGYGTDGTVWGGEFFSVDEKNITRVARLLPLLLPGGETAVREPRRAALGVYHEIFGDDIFSRDDIPFVRSFSAQEKGILRHMLATRLQCPQASSMGRLFDATASVLNLSHVCDYEAQAAMRLEFSALSCEHDDSYPLPLIGDGNLLNLDWRPMMTAILNDFLSGESVGRIAARFHNALANAIVAVARRYSMTQIALSGGCFQNRYLMQRTAAVLTASGFEPYFHQDVPPNDGGLALGQLIAAARLNNKVNEPVTK